MRVRELAKDMGLYGVMAGVSKLTGFLLLPLFTRAFATDEYGILEIITVFVSLGATIFRLSLPSAVARYFFDERTDGRRDELVTTLVLTMLICVAVGLIAGWSLADEIAGLLFDRPEDGRFIVVALWSMLFAVAASVPQMVLRMERRIVAYNLLDIIQSFSYAGLGIFFVFGLDMGIIGVLWGSAVARALKLGVAIITTREYYTLAFSFPLLRRSLGFSLPLLPAVVVTWVNQQADRVILLAFLGLSSVGVFGAAARIAMILTLGTTIFRQAWIPFAMSLVDHPASERNAFYRQVMNYFICGFAALALSLTAFGPELLWLLVPPEYGHGYVVIPWLAGAVVAHAAASIASIGVMLSEKTFINTIAAWLGAVTNVTLGLTLIPLLGIRGAAIGAMVAEVLFVSILWYYSERTEKVGFAVGPVVRTVGIYVVVSIALVEMPASTTGDWLTVLYRVGLLLASIGLIVQQMLDAAERRWLLHSVRGLGGRLLSSSGGS